MTTLKIRLKDSHQPHTIRVQATSAAEEKEVAATIKYALIQLGHEAEEVRG